MKKFLSICLLTVGLAACAQLNNAYNAATGSSLSPTTVIVAANAFDGVEATATNYLRLTKCNGNNRPICRDPAATRRIIPAVRSGRAARNSLEAFLRANPGALGPSGLYNALVTATSTLKQIFLQYNIQ